MAYTIHHGDCLEVLRGMADNSVDAVVTDPPYGLSFMGKKWDYDVPSEDVWRECLRVLKPGGHLLAFAGTRTQHRMAVRIEDAGFEIRDMIAWVYGSGFPKSLDVSKAIDKAAGAGRKVIGSKLGQPGYTLKQNDTDEHARKAYGKFKDAEAECAITAPATESARQWQGWGTALKPALEPITMARKPLVGTVAANVLEHGTGALNIDGCRVAGADAKEGRTRHGGGIAGNGSSYELPDFKAPMPAGRWPANLIHDGSEEVVGLFPVTESGAMNSIAKGGQFNTFGAMAERRVTNPASKGSAARFFYCAKASKRDRDEGMDGFERRNPAVESAHSTVCAKCNRQRVNVRGACNCESPDWVRVQQTPRANHHPTVKPTDLMRYLCRLVTPPSGTVLDPFAGSGSTGKAAVLEGFNFIGIERDADYIKIAEARLRHASTQMDTLLPL